MMSYGIHGSECSHLINCEVDRDYDGEVCQSYFFVSLSLGPLTLQAEAHFITLIDSAADYDAAGNFRPSI